MKFPSLLLADWQETRNTLQRYAQILGKIKSAIAPPQKHHWHVALSVSSIGLTTNPLWLNNQTIEISLDLRRHELVYTTSLGESHHRSIASLSVKEAATWLQTLLAKTGTLPEFDFSQLQNDETPIYDITAASHFWQILSQIDTLFNRFRAAQRGETGPVVLWPHHFDLALLTFSGELIPDQDPDNPEYADEQMNFGFVTGDNSIQEAYFYITAYPTPEHWTNHELSKKAYWFTDGFKAAVLPYKALTNATDPEKLLLDYMNMTQKTVNQSA